MHTIYLGYSTKLTDREVVEYFDIPTEDDELESKFERRFGSEYIRPGDFEVYGRQKCASWTAEAIAEMLPFHPDEVLLRQLDFSSSKSIFYVKTDSVSVMRNEEITLVGPMKVIKFDFEE